MVDNIFFSSMGIAEGQIKCVFQKVKQNAIELVKEIWLMLLHTLRGQYKAIIGEPDVVIRKQQQF